MISCGKNPGATFESTALFGLLPINECCFMIYDRSRKFFLKNSSQVNQHRKTRAKLILKISQFLDNFPKDMVAQNFLFDPTKQFSDF